jgi:hypothetical protein
MYVDAAEIDVEMPLLVEKHGQQVYSLLCMDELRKKQCLCLRCAEVKKCATAKILYNLCKDAGLAMMITRCKYWKG